MSLPFAETILIVETDSVVRDEYRRAVTLAGYRVVAPETNAEALKYVEQYCPAAVILDPRNSRISENELYLSMRGRTQTRDVPVIVVTDAEVPAEQSLYDYYLRKPVRREQLVGALETALRRGPVSNRYMRLLDDEEVDEG